MVGLTIDMFEVDELAYHNVTRDVALDVQGMPHLNPDSPICGGGRVRIGLHCALGIFHLWADAMTLALYPVECGLRIPRKREVYDPAHLTVHRPPLVERPRFELYVRVRVPHAIDYRTAQVHAARAILADLQAMRAGPAPGQRVWYPASVIAW
jgi:hypothetical protein